MAELSARYAHCVASHQSAGPPGLIAAMTAQGTGKGDRFQSEPC
jgi:hypothetical protein